jgi:glycosidase
MSQEDVESALDPIDWARLTEGREFFPSPAGWADEVLYFLFVDRFSDGREFGGFRDVAGAEVAGPAAERATPPFHLETDASNVEREAWFAAGRRGCGGTVAGLIDKLGNLRRLGVCAVWLNPLFRQVTGTGRSAPGTGFRNTWMATS